MKILTLPGLRKTFQDFFGANRGFEIATEGANPDSPTAGFRIFYDNDHLLCEKNEDGVVGNVVVEKIWDYGDIANGPTHNWGDAGNGTLDFRGYR